MKHLNLIVCAVALTSVVASAFAEDDGGLQHRLKGTYRVAGTESCAEAQLGFTDPPVLEANSPAISLYNHVEGDITFDGSGSANFKGALAAVIPAFPGYVPVAQPFARVGFTCDWTYAVDSNGRFNLQGACTADGLAGGIAGATDVISGYDVTGLIGLGGNVLVTSDTQANEQTLVRYYQGVEVYSAKRLCTSSLTFLRASRPSSHYDDTDD